MTNLRKDTLSQALWVLSIGGIPISVMGLVSFIEHRIDLTLLELPSYILEQYRALIRSLADMIPLPFGWSIPTWYLDLYTFALIIITSVGRATLVKVTPRWNEIEKQQDFEFDGTEIHAFRAILAFNIIILPFFIVPALIFSFGSLFGAPFFSREARLSKEPGGDPNDTLWLEIYATVSKTAITYFLGTLLGASLFLMCNHQIFK